ncbi:MAG: type II toxin-antitoxin system VapB family antitoxin [Gammaproteobacteria bacterium]|nr:type II toxin-antitoxin system VapB family antitoxin [Gammaproteobacteria bacterium]
MHMNIKNPETHRLARELAELTGESMTRAVTRALEERLERERRRRGRAGIGRQLLAIGRRAASRGLKDPRPADEILGYDEAGLPR